MTTLPQPPRGECADRMDQVELSRWFTEIWKEVNRSKGVSGSFISQDGKTVTALNGIITSIV